MNWQKHFPQLEPALLEVLEKEGTHKTIPAGETILRTGQYIRSTVLLLDGRIKIYRENGEGSEFLVYYINPGEACAVSMTCAMQESSSEISAQADEDSEVLMIPIHLMDDLMQKYKSWYQFVIGTYRSRFDELLLAIDHIAFRNMDERLEFYLKRLSDQRGIKQLELSHQRIADDLNSSREVISRLLKKMEQRGLVKLHRSMIEIS